MNASFNRWTKFGTGAAGLILLVVIIGSIVAIFGNLRLRHDFTADKLYTLSGGSRAVLGRLQNDVTLKFYFNRSSPAAPMFIKSYARQVEDLLKEYAIASHGRLVLEIHDPKPDSDEEEWAQRYGIQAQPTGVMTPPLYFGLVAVSGEREEKIPALSPQSEATLEYDLTRLISRVATTAKPVIGVMSELPVMGQPAPMMPNMRPTPPKPWYVIQELQRDFDVRAIQPDAASIDADITTLLVIHPKDASPKTLYAIDQFVMRGGRLIACVDPLSLFEMENQQQNQMAMMGMNGPSSSTLGPLFKAWGVGFDTGRLLADMRAMTRLGGAGGRVEESPIFLSLGAANLNKGDLLTAQLDQIMMPFAGVLSDATGDDVAFEPLISSSDASCLVDAQMAMFGTEALRSQLKPDGLRHVIAARLSGRFASAFPEGAPAANDADDGDQAAAAPTASHLTLCAEPNAMLIVADSDFLADRFAVREVEVFYGFKSLQAINDNLAFLANAVEKLSGGVELISIRSRGASRRPFTKVDELEFKAMTAWRAEEERLAAELQQTQQQLAELQNQKQGSQKFILSPEQEKAIQRFQQKQTDVKAQLKQVRRNLNRDIETLGVRIKVLNIIGIPVLVILFGVVFSIRHRRLH